MNNNNSSSINNNNNNNDSTNIIIVIWGAAVVQPVPSVVFQGRVSRKEREVPEFLDPGSSELEMTSGKTASG